MVFILFLNKKTTGEGVPVVLNNLY